MGGGRRLPGQVGGTLRNPWTPRGGGKLWLKRVSDRAIFLFLELSSVVGVLADEHELRSHCTNTNGPGPLSTERDKRDFNPPPPLGEAERPGPHTGANTALALGHRKPTPTQETRGLPHPSPQREA